MNNRLQSCLYKLFIQLPEYPASIFPENSYFFGKWGLPGIKTIYWSRQLARLSSSIHEDDSEEIEAAYDKFSSSRFSCVYGKAFSKPLRDIIKRTHSSKIATLPELRKLSIGGYIYETRNRDIGFSRTKSQIMADIFMCIAVPTLSITCSSLFIFAPHIATNLRQPISIASVFAVLSVYFIYTNCVKPYAISKRINMDLNRIKNQVCDKTPFKLICNG